MTRIYKQRIEIKYLSQIILPNAYKVELINLNIIKEWHKEQDIVIQ